MCESKQISAVVLDVEKVSIPNAALSINPETLDEQSTCTRKYSMRQLLFSIGHAQKAGNDSG